MKRKMPLKASKKHLKRVPLRRVSPERKAQLAVYYSVRRAFLRANRFCEAYILGVCSIRATEIHHINGRNGERLLNDEWFLPVCRNCHSYLHQNPKWAREKGFLK